MKVLISDSMPKAASEVLESAGIGVDVKIGLDSDELKAIINNYDGLIVRSATQVTLELLAKVRNLKVITRAGSGGDNIDIQAATDRGVLVMNTPGRNSNAVAELTIGLMLAASRNIPQGTSTLKAGQWEKKTLMGREVAGKTLGLIGLGNIGSLVAQAAKGLHMKVIAYSRSLNQTKAEKLGVQFSDLDEILGQADYVSLHVPKTDQTAMLMNAKRIAKMKLGAYLICTARGGIVDEGALCQALQSGKLAGAALDVFATEPPGACALMECQNFICTPHLGASTYEAQKSVALAASEQTRDFLLKGKVHNALNRVAIGRNQAQVREVITS